jgi:hypothetical protein
MPSSARKRRGVAAVFVMILLPVLLGAAAFAVDAGFIYNCRAQMQNAADSAALAGASALHLDHEEVRRRASAYASKNLVANIPVSLLPEDIEIGHWERETGNFSPASGGPTDLRANAVRVVGRRSGIPLFFARIFGKSSTDVAREAIALCDAGHCYGIWGLNGIDGVGSITTDSYVSALGPYGPGNMDQNGDLCSNRDIGLRGNVDIHGDVMHGVDYECILRGGSHSIWGTVGPTGDLEAPPVDVSDAWDENDNGAIGLTDQGHEPLVDGKLVLRSTDNLTLAPGTYLFHGASMTGQATLTVTGPTVIYVDEDAKFTGGGIQNVTQDPKNLLIYATCDELDLKGAAGFYGAVVAPDTEVTLVGTSDYFGMIIADTVRINGDVNVHVDETLVAMLLDETKPAIPVLVK